MIIKTIINKYQFMEAFMQFDRKDNFSYNGLKALFEYLEEYSDDLGTPIELDVIALCCEFTEYKDLKELQGAYPAIEDMEDLRNHTLVIEVENGGFIIQNF